MSSTNLKAPEDYYPEILRDLADRVARKLVETNVCQPAQASAIGRSLADDVSDAWQGQIIVVPKAAQYKARVRWNEMWEAFNGHNHAELGRRYGMGVKQVYRVLKHMSAYHRSRGPDLFAQATQAQAQAQALAQPRADLPTHHQLGVEDHAQQD
jgi:Mor family transcriptional regulator